MFRREDIKRLLHKDQPTRTWERGQTVKPKLDGEGNVLCPSCGSKDWHEGPGGCGSQNVQCSSCGDYWNHTPFGLHFLKHDKLPLIEKELSELPH